MKGPNGLNDLFIKKTTNDINFLFALVSVFDDAINALIRGFCQ